MGKISNTEKSLKDQLKAALSRIESLELELIQYKEKNMLYVYKMWEEDINEYHPHLNPYPVQISATHKNKTLFYKIKPQEILCITSNGRMKTIYLNSAIENTEGEYFPSNKITVNKDEYTLDYLCRAFDHLNFRIVQISKSVAVNVAYYHRNNSKVTVKYKAGFNESLNFPIGSKFVSEFDRMKSHFEALNSLHNSPLGSKSNIITKPRPNFGKKTMSKSK